MSISRIRGEQIKLNVITNQHIAEGAAIHESKLDVDWSAKYKAALETKKLVDFVQVNGTDVEGVSEVALDVLLPELASATPVNSDPLSGEGIVIDSPKNFAPIRDVVTGEPIKSASNAEVFGRMTHDGTKYVLKFFSKEMVDVEGTPTEQEVAYVMPAGQKIDWQFAQRFNLETVSELFAANEKFVAGVADMTSALNIQQLAKDIYGATYTLDRDGAENLAKSLVEQLADEVAARQVADQAILDKLASTDAGKGASVVGIQAGTFTATNVQDALVELDGRVDAANDEVVAGRSSELLGDFATLDERLEAGETRFENKDIELDGKITAEKTRAEGAETALQTAISDEVTRATGEEARIEGKVDAEVTRATAAEAALQGEVDAVEADLAQYKIDQAAVDAAQDSAIDAVEAVINGALDSDAKGTDDGLGGITPKHFESLDARLEEIESDAKTEKTAREAADNTLNGKITQEVSDRQAADTTLQGNIDAEVTRATAAESALQGEVDAVEADLAQYKIDQAAKDAAQDTALTNEVSAREAADTALQGEVDAVEADLAQYKVDQAVVDDAQDARLTAIEAKLPSIHNHIKGMYQATGGESTVTIDQFGLSQAFVVGGGADIFVNGILQSEGLHYSEGVDGLSVNFDVAGDGTVLVAGDVVTIKYHVVA